MTVRELLDKKGHEVFFLKADESVEEAIQLMHAKKISAVLVGDKDKTVGIFTERDVLKCYLSKEGMPFNDIPLKDVMTSDLVVARPDEELCDIMSIMIDRGIRHLPVMENDKVIGMMSIRDIVKTQVGNLKSEIHHLKDYIVGVPKELWETIVGY